jgi:thiopurine S-methyltransferase
MILDESFWENRYKKNDIGWDIGYVSTPLKTYFDQLTNKELKILLPGGGNSYEAEYLYHSGFKNTHVIDLSETALSNLKVRVPDFPDSNLIHDNFFDLEAKFDLIIEQTFFCAIDPSLRHNYVAKTHELLLEKGKLVGLLFNVVLNVDHPPYGGSKEEYRSLFDTYFDLDIFDLSYNSIPERRSNELFIKFIKNPIS